MCMYFHYPLFGISSVQFLTNIFPPPSSQATGSGWILPGEDERKCWQCQPVQNETPPTFQEPTRVPALGEVQVCGQPGLLHEQQGDGRGFNPYQVRDWPAHSGEVQPAGHPEWAGSTRQGPRAVRVPWPARQLLCTWGDKYRAHKTRRVLCYHLICRPAGGEDDWSGRNLVQLRPWEPSIPLLVLGGWYLWWDWELLRPNRRPSVLCRPTQSIDCLWEFELLFFVLPLR